MQQRTEISILKSLWARTEDRGWTVNDARSIRLRAKPGCDAHFFSFENEIEILSRHPPGSLLDAAGTFGSTNFLMKQSILPVVALTRGESMLRCIGTAFLISCTGYIITAAHVVLDPLERGYGRIVGRHLELSGDFYLGVLIPVSPVFGGGFRIVPFDDIWYWGNWEKTPLFYEDDRLEMLTDIAICKIRQGSSNIGYQPLNISLDPFEKGETAYAIGYALMEDIPIAYIDGRALIEEPKFDLYVSIGDVINIFPRNDSVNKQIPTPGPSFDFQAYIPGKMSGSPIFGGHSSTIRGVVSRSFSGEKHAYGCMISPIMEVPFTDGKSIRMLMEAGSEGIPVVQFTKL
jgi:hypothetical protein